MKRFRFRPRTWIVLGVVTVIAAAAAVAGYAYFSTSGTGTGVAATGGTGTVGISDFTNATGLWPDGSDHTFIIDLYDGGGGALQVNSVTGTVPNFVGNGGNTCYGGWFSISMPDYTFPLSINPGDNYFYAHITMPVSGDNQSACQGQTVPINWSSN